MDSHGLRRLPRARVHAEQARLLRPREALGGCAADPGRGGRGARSAAAAACRAREDLSGAHTMTLAEARPAAGDWRGMESGDPATRRVLELARRVARSQS